MSTHGAGTLLERARPDLSSGPTKSMCWDQREPRRAGRLLAAGFPPSRKQGFGSWQSFYTESPTAQGGQEGALCHQKLGGAKGLLKGFQPRLADALLAMGCLPGPWRSQENGLDVGTDMSRVHECNQQVLAEVVCFFLVFLKWPAFYTYS